MVRFAWRPGSCSGPRARNLHHQLCRARLRRRPREDPDRSGLRRGGCQHDRALRPRRSRATRPLGSPEIKRAPARTSACCAAPVRLAAGRWWPAARTVATSNRARTRSPSRSVKYSNSWCCRAHSSLGLGIGARICAGLSTRLPVVKMSRMVPSLTPVAGHKGRPVVDPNPTFWDPTDLLPSRMRLRPKVARH